MEITDAFNPRVSIVIPVYNGSNFLREAIESALAQTYKNIEVIIVNDGSNDQGKTEAIATSYGDRVRYFKKENGGVASALNLGIREMTGEFFSWLSHDDIYYPNKIEAQIQYLSNHRKGDIILYSDYEFIDAASTLLRRKRLKDIDPGKFLIELLISCPVQGCTTLVSKKCFAEVGIFDERLRTAQDYDLWFRMARRFPFVHMSQILVKSRVHQDQGSLAIQDFATEANQLIKRCLGELSDEEISRITHEPSSLFYLKVAVKLRLFLFDDASAFAWELSGKNKGAEPRQISLQRMVLTGLYGLLHPKFNPRYWVRRLRRLRTMKRKAEDEGRYGA